MECRWIQEDFRRLLFGFRPKDESLQVCYTFQSKNTQSPLIHDQRQTWNYRAHRDIAVHKIPILGGRLRRTYCGHIEQVIQDYLEGWQACALSIMGKIILVRLVLSSIPIHLLSNAILSKILVTRLKQYFQNFLWGFSAWRLTPCKL